MVAACLWESREAAEKCFNAEWQRQFGQRYGMVPTITYFATPVVVDNALGLIEGDVAAGPFGGTSHGPSEKSSMAAGSDTPVRAQG